MGICPLMVTENLSGAVVGTGKERFCRGYPGTHVLEKFMRQGSCVNKVSEMVGAGRKEQEIIC